MHVHNALLKLGTWNRAGALITRGRDLLAVRGGNVVRMGWWMDAPGMPKCTLPVLHAPIGSEQVFGRLPDRGFAWVLHQLHFPSLIFSTLFDEDYHN